MKQLAAKKGREELFLFIEDPEAIVYLYVFCINVCVSFLFAARRPGKRGTGCVSFLDVEKKKVAAPQAFGP